ncbi:MAG: diguanylate cyclase [Gemmatimonadetes bacterium]|nr:diguanylate cyclase [Gemmatimonadota bacterium]
MTEPHLSGSPATPAKAEALLVSDRGPLVRSLRVALERAGYDVIWAHTGEIGLARSREYSPDLVVADVELADVPVLEWCASLRKESSLAPSTPVMVVSTEPISREQRLAALRSGAWDCVPGPPDPEELLLKADLYVRSKLDVDRAESVGLIDPMTGLYNRQGLARRARELGAHAFRTHDALACVALSVDFESPVANQVPPEELRPAIMRCARALQAAGRPSDPIGRMAPSEFAVLAPATDAAGAQKMAERMTRTLQEATGQNDAQVRVPEITAGYEAVTNLAYAPIGPVELLARATGALRQARSERSGTIRRFTEPA